MLALPGGYRTLFGNCLALEERSKVGSPFLVICGQLATEKAGGGTELALSIYAKLSITRIARPSRRICVVSQLLWVRQPLLSQIMCAGNGNLLRVGPLIIVRRFNSSHSIRLRRPLIGCRQAES